MDFYTILDQVVDLLRQRATGDVSGPQGPVHLMMKPGGPQRRTYREPNSSA